MQHSTHRGQPSEINRVLWPHAVIGIIIIFCITFSCCRCGFPFSFLNCFLSVSIGSAVSHLGSLLSYDMILLSIIFEGVLFSWPLLWVHLFLKIAYFSVIVYIDIIFVILGVLQKPHFINYTRTCASLASGSLKSKKKK